MPSSNFLDFIHCASRICLGPNAKALVSRWRQICPLKINIFTLNAPISTNKVSMFKLSIEVCFENNFGSIHAIFLLLGLTKSVYFFWDTRYMRNISGHLMTFSSVTSGQSPNYEGYMMSRANFE